MKNTLISISNLIEGVLSKEVDGNPVRTLCLLVTGLAREEVKYAWACLIINTRRRKRIMESIRG